MFRLEANRRNARLVESSDEDSDDEEALAETVAAVTRLTHNNTPAKGSPSFAMLFYNSAHSSC